MAVHPRDNELVIGTHGRSVLILDIKDIARHEPANGSYIGDNLVFRLRPLTTISRAGPKWPK